MTPALTIPISSARVLVRFKFMFTLLREAWRNVADFLASRPVDINFLQTQSDDDKIEQNTKDWHLNAVIQLSKSLVLKHFIWNVAVLESMWISLRPGVVEIAALWREI
jgi:hypothetical protein